MNETKEVRFRRHVRAEANGCLIWTGGRTPKGYGNFSDGQTRLAHRVAYEMANGPIAPGLTVDHLCRNRACVNPAHLELVTNRENILRGTSPSANHARKTHCPKGHPYDEANTRISVGFRHCRTCDHAAWKRPRVRAA